MKKLTALFAGAVSIALGGWYGGAHAERQRIKAEFSNTQATIVLHCGPINAHDLAAREKPFPVMDNTDRWNAAFESAYQMDGAVIVLNDCKTDPKRNGPLLPVDIRSFP